MSERDDGGMTEGQIVRLLTDVYRATGLDFREYSETMVKRRIVRRFKKWEAAREGELPQEGGGRQRMLEQLAADLLIHVTELFRDPSMYRALREKAIPSFARLPHVRIWIAGCATGEEVYSLAIMLHEAGLLPRCTLYATDVSEAALQEACRGIIHPAKYDIYERNYAAAGGTGALDDYVETVGAERKFRSFLRDSVVFSRHDLARDGVFHEFDAISCRNVMIYFNAELKAKVNRKLFDSLKPGGYFILGGKESIRFTEQEAEFETIDANGKIYKKREGGDVHVRSRRQN